MEEWGVIPPLSYFVIPPPLTESQIACPVACPAPCHGTGQTPGGALGRRLGCGEPDGRPAFETVDRPACRRFGGSALGELTERHESIGGRVESAPRAQQGPIAGGDCRFQAGDFLADVRVGLGLPGGVRGALSRRAPLRHGWHARAPERSPRGAP